jgi:hypothetical protein
MKSIWIRWFALGVALLAMGLVGCAQERPPINQVQANALDKSFFVGPKLNDDSDNPEFYSRGFIIDSSAGQSGLSVGLYTGLDRIKWQITEDYLIARKSYQLAQDQDPKTQDGLVDGTIVARYKILSHFDIKRAYNPQTGENLNIITENTTDRPWYERQYMRVDWSTNDVQDPMWEEVFLGKIFGDLTVEPLTYSVTDPTSEDAPHFEVKNGYFDITNMYYVAPSETQLWGFQIPTCILVGLYTGTTTTDCNAQEAKVRFSYWKTDPNHDFEPTENTYRKLDVIANFGGAGSSFEPGFAGGTTQCWDPQYQYDQACFHQYLSKMNFWKQSHERIGSCNTDADCVKNGLAAGSTCMPDHTCTVYCGSDADANGNGTADACENSKTHYTGSQGSQCDMSQGTPFYHQCTLPLRDRVLQPQGYWLNKETPASLEDPLDSSGNPTSAMLGADGKPAASNADYQVPTFRGALEDTVKSWNQLVTTSIAYGRETECRRTAEDGKAKGDPTKARTDCHAKYFVTNNGNDVTQMIAFGGWGIATPQALPSDGPAALVACHAPVRSYDYQPVCGKVLNDECTGNDCAACPAGMARNLEGECADVARAGDLRKNWLFYWPYDSAAEYGGVSGLYADPETGEEHGVTATIMGRSATWAAARYRDWLQVAMGDITVNDYTSGVPEFVYNKILQNGYSPESAMARKARGETIAYSQQHGGAGTGSSSSGAQNASGAKAPTPGTANPAGREATAKPATVPVSVAEQQKVLDMVNNRVSSVAVNGAFESDAQPRWDALASTLRNTDIEAELVGGPHWAVEAVGADPSTQLSSPFLSSMQTDYPAGESFTEMDAASPFRQLDPGTMEQWRAQIGRMLADAGVCYTDNETSIGSVNFLGLARWYEDKFEGMKLASDVKNKDSTGLWLLGGQRDASLVKQRGQIIYQDLVKGMVTGIAIHEFGHTLGMRHNFESSYDAINFMPQYWQLRTDEGEATQACSGPRDPSQPDSCMGPRFNDPETLDEEGLAQPDASGRSQGRPRIDYFGNTSVMEYEQDYMSPGIGPYDFMYTEAVYGGVLETYDIDHVSQGGIAEGSQGQFVANLGLDSAEFRLENDNFIHYTALARDMHVFQESYCRQATPTELQQGQWRVVHGKICTRSPRDRFFWKDFINDTQDGKTPPTGLASTSTTATGTGWTFTAWRTSPNMPQADGRDHERWPYRYGEEYEPSYIQANYTDNGADPYEVAVNNAAIYDATYPEYYFRRQEKDYMYYDLPSRISTRYFERERSYHWILETMLGNHLTGNYLGDPDVSADYQNADRETFYFLARAAMAPEPGPMGPQHQVDGSTVYDVSSGGGGPLGTTFETALIDGRYVGEDYSSYDGGSWDYLNWIDHAGFGMERGMAISALVDPRPTLYTISRQTFLDGRAVMVNYQNDDALGLDRFLGGILSEDWKDVAPWVPGSNTCPSGESTCPGNEGTAPDNLVYKSPQVMNLLDATVTRPAGSYIVNPDIGYRTEFQTLVFSDFYSALNSDTTLMKKLAIFIQGQDGYIAGVPPADTISITDPNSGYTFVALDNFGPDDTVAGNTVSQGIAARMIQHAKDLQAANCPASGACADTDFVNYMGFLQEAHEIERDLSSMAGWNTFFQTFD